MVSLLQMGQDYPPYWISNEEEPPLPTVEFSIFQSTISPGQENQPPREEEPPPLDPAMIRKERNKASARRNREQVKERFAFLEREKTRLESENRTLRTLIKELLSKSKPAHSPKRILRSRK